MKRIVYLGRFWVQRLNELTKFGIYYVPSSCRLFHLKKFTCTRYDVKLGTSLPPVIGAIYAFVPWTLRNYSKQVWNWISCLKCEDASFKEGKPTDVFIVNACKPNACAMSYLFFLVQTCSWIDNIECNTHWNNAQLSVSRYLRSLRRCSSDVL